MFLWWSFPNFRFHVEPREEGKLVGPDASLCARQRRQAISTAGRALLGPS